MSVWAARQRHRSSRPKGPRAPCALPHSFVIITKKAYNHLNHVWCTPEAKTHLVYTTYPAMTMKKSSRFHVSPR